MQNLNLQDDDITSLLQYCSFQQFETGETIFPAHVVAKLTVCKPYRVIATDLLTMYLKLYPDIILHVDDVGHLPCNYISPSCSELLNLMTPPWSHRLCNYFEDVNCKTIITMSYIKGNVWNNIPVELIDEIFLHLDPQPKYVTNL